MTDVPAKRYTEALQFAEGQVDSLVIVHPDFFPCYTVDGKWRHEGESWTEWTGGFLTGMMWNFFQRTGQDVWRDRAEHYSSLLELRQVDRNVHDLGFLFLNSYLPWYERTGDEALRAVLLQAGKTLGKRFIETGGYLCSFMGLDSLFIDIMMNVPLLFWVAKETNDNQLRDVALTHCRTTAKWLVRPDGSTAHEGKFDLASGQFLGQSTQQGLRPESVWARGTAWSMYGFSKVYAMTGEPTFLEVAERTARFWLENLPEDRVPYWDFDADLSKPPPWGAQKDSSAGAIAASGLLDLADQTESQEHAIAYHTTARAILDALVSPDYLADQTPGWEGILKHAVYHTAKNLGVDESVAWGDFFLVEALTKVVLKNST
ncbi:MAG: glycoside hydrolase family 88 protein [Pirellulales bacterium]|nr:glycoside hydrolase family 88 protein [Pirellulales bacterium]